MPKRFSADYSAADIYELYKSRSSDGDEGRLRSTSALMRQMCRMELEPTIPRQYQAITKAVKTPFVRDAWHRISTSLCSKPPVVHITPKDERRQEYREAANIAERFDLAMIERGNKERGEDIVYNLTAGQVRDGESVLKVVHRPQAWASFPAREGEEEADSYTQRAEDYKRGSDMPIVWADLDRLSIVPEGGQYGDEWVVEYGEYTRPYLKQRYRMAKHPSDDRLINPKDILEGRAYPEGLHPSGLGNSTKLEFFTSREWHVVIDGVEAPGWPKKNPYAPYLPYFRAKCYDSESLLYSLMFLVPRLDELLTMKLNWSYLGSYPNPVLETVPNSNAAFPALDGPLGLVGRTEGPDRALTWTPGKLMDLPLGRTLSFLAPPPVGKDLNDLVVIIKSLIDIAGIPSIMRGMSGAGDSGYLANQLRAAAEMAYKLAAISAQRQLEKATEFTHWLIKSVIKQPVYVLGWSEINAKTGRPTAKASQGWLGLSPDTQTKNVADIGKLGPVSFQYRPTLPTDEQARAMIAMQLTNAAKPLYDRRHALEIWLQEEDPEAILDALYVEEALEQEPLKSMVLDEALRDAGLLPPRQAPSPTPQLVDQFGQPIQSGPGGPIPPGMQGVPLANQAPPGMAGIPGLTMPLAPAMPQGPQGIPGDVGGRPPGMYPGMPSNQGQ